MMKEKFELNSSNIETTDKEKKERMRNAESSIDKAISRMNKKLEEKL